MFAYRNWNGALVRSSLPTKIILMASKGDDYGTRIKRKLWILNRPTDREIVIMKFKFYSLHVCCRTKLFAVQTGKTLRKTHLRLNIFLCCSIQKYFKIPDFSQITPLIIIVKYTLKYIRVGRQWGCKFHLFPERVRMYRP